MSIKQRWETVNKSGVCTNCLKRDHKTAVCDRQACPRCPGQKHNSLLCQNTDRRDTNRVVTHAMIMTPADNKANAEQEKSGEQTEQIIITMPSLQTEIKEQTMEEAKQPAQKPTQTRKQQEPEEQVLLATARVLLEAHDGTLVAARALCDSGSQMNLITADCQRRLGYKIEPGASEIRVAGRTTVQAQGLVQFRMFSCTNPKYVTKMSATVMGKITSLIPSRPVLKTWPELEQLELADPKYKAPHKIDILLGAAVWAEIVKPRIMRGTDHRPTAQQTDLGWLIYGKFKAVEEVQSCNIVYVDEAEESIEHLLRRFWEVHEPAAAERKTPTELEVEKQFEQTHYRDEEGRYVVRLPFSNESSSLRASRNIAGKRFASLERRLTANPQLAAQYADFIAEFESLNHMHEIQAGDNLNGEVIIPHHAIDNGKFRVVFDGSCKYADGHSLNDILMDGPKQQDELIDIQLRFRVHAIAMSADVVKMFRQVKVHQEDAVAQRILWRRAPDEEIITLQHDRVVYGMKPASYLAIAALRQCAIDHRADYPQAADVALRDFYVDDLLTGADNEEDALKLYTDLNEMLQKGKFPLAKWTSNSWHVNSSIGDVNSGNARSMNERDVATVLGMHWSPSADTIRWRVKGCMVMRATKRNIISEIAKLYDPNGLLSPIVIRGKIIIQTIWKTECGWDQTVNDNIKHQFEEFIGELPAIESLQVPRWIGANTRKSKVQLHGFADASDKAYGAAVYVRLTGESGRWQTTLLHAKAKAAPVKTVTTPRLELCAAELLGRTVEQITRALGKIVKIDQTQVHCWSDSMVTLHWIRKLPCLMKTYVANRVSSVQTTTKGAAWRHVPTKDNPADELSRGTTARELIDSRLWWGGPPWLSLDEQQWPEQPSGLTEVEQVIAKREERLQEVLLITVPSNADIDINGVPLIDRYSSWRKTVRVMKCVLRAKDIWLNKLSAGPVHPTDPQVSDVTEYLAAEQILIRAEQIKYAPLEMQQLKAGQPISRRSEWLQFNPKLDGEGVARMEGRIVRADEADDVRRPIIIPAKSRAARQIIQMAHLATMHAGVQGTMHYIRQRYWIPRLRQLTRAALSKCVLCHRFNARPLEQLMAPLPAVRIRPTPPFQHTGVDYAGPVKLIAWAQRRKVDLNGYVALFVCMATRAVHLEAVTDMTTEAFMAAYRRLASRRGNVQTFYSDNGTNFVGASREMEMIWQTWKGSELQTLLDQEQVKWIFNSPSAPHQGGLWEAAVKSCKHHLRRMMKGCILTFEQLSTLLAQIEAILNSRPLYPMSDDPADYQAITPAHLISGRPLVAPLMRREDLQHVPPTRRWAIIQEKVRLFWESWRNDYLLSLQRRAKWTTPRPNLEVGTMVLILEDNQPAALWSMGRVLRTIPDSQGIVRNVVLKTAHGELRRPIQKVSVLPTNEPEVNTTA